jgi:hypothetical protein
VIAGGRKTRGWFWQSRWVAVAICGFVLAAPTAGRAATGLGLQARVAAITPGDRAATHALLKAEYELMKATLAGEGTAEAAMARVAKALGHECRGVLRGAPRRPVIEVESYRRSTQRLSGRTGLPVPNGPAMAIGVADHVWTLREIAKLPG